VKERVLKPLATAPRHPAAAYTTRPKATPGNRDTDIHDRIRHDTIDKAGRVTLRHQQS